MTKKRYAPALLRPAFPGRTLIFVLQGAAGWQKQEKKECGEEGHVRKRRKGQGRKRTARRGSEEDAEAVEGMQKGHARPAEMLFYEHALRVHARVQHAHEKAEYPDADSQLPHVHREHGPEQGNDHERGAPAAEPPRPETPQGTGASQKRRESAQAHGQDDQAHLSLICAHLGLEGRHAREKNGVENR